MSDTVIKVENLSKSAPRGLPIRHQSGERYTALRDVVSNGVKGMGNRLLGRTNGHVDTSREEFWALDDVSFEVKQGAPQGAPCRHYWAQRGAPRGAPGRRCSRF